jgi:hypothetical protein
MPEHQDRKDPMDQQVMQVPQALMANQEIKDHVDPPAHPDQLETQETKDPLAIPAKSLVPNPAPQAQQVQLANPVHQALQADLARVAKMAVPAPQVLQAMLVLQAVQAKLAVPAALAMLANPAHLAVANTAHQLVWLQVIKHLHRSKRLDDTIHRQIYDSIIFILSLTIPNSTSSEKYQCNFLFLLKRSMLKYFNFI